MVQAGKPVTGEDFIGRENEMAQLLAYLSMGQSVVVIAPRRFGKTSLILEAIQNLREQNLFTAYVDIFSNPTLELLSTNITMEVLRNHKLHKQFMSARKSAVELIKNVKLKAVLDDFQFIIGFADKDLNEWELVSESIDFVDSFSRKHHRQIVCAYDEFGDIDKYDTHNDLVKLFRSKIQQHKNSTYIFSGSYESVMNQMFVDDKSPFHRLTRIIRLGYIEARPLVHSLAKRFSTLEISVPGSLPDEIIRFTRGHPYYSQLAFQQVVLNKTLRKKIPTIEELMDLMLIVEKDYLEKTWENLSRNREMVYTLLALAEESENIYQRLKHRKINVARAINKLEGKGLLFKDQNDRYYISDPLFEQWLRKRL